MSAYATSLLACAGLFVLILGSGAAGYHLGKRRKQQTGGDVATATVDAAILSLLGLLIAFTFSNAYARFETRRSLIVDEANAIGTAMLRLDLLSNDDRHSLRSLFREYVHSRYQLWEVLPDRTTALQLYSDSAALQNRIWTKAVQATAAEDHGDARKLLLPAINDMIDITTTRLVAMQSHPPLVIFLTLGLLAIAAAALMGFGMAGSESFSLLHVGSFAAALSLSLLLIFDIEYPRHGVVRLDEEHQLLLDLERSLRSIPGG